MRTLSKRFLLVAMAAVALLFTIILIGLNLYLGLSGIREQAEIAFSRELGVPVKIGGFHYWPWSGLEATGLNVTIEQLGIPGQPTVFQLPSVSAKFSLIPLFSGNLVVKRLLFSEPSLTLVETPKNGWVLPIPSLGQRTVDVPLPHAKKQDKKGQPAPAKTVKLDLRIQRAQVRNATFRFIDKNGTLVAVVEGMTVKCPLETVAKIEGKISISTVTINNSEYIQDLVVPFQWDGASLSMPQISGQLAGGSLRGKAAVRMPFETTPFTLDLLFDSVEMEKLLPPSSQQGGGRPKGKLNGNLDLYGFMNEKESIRGFAHARLNGGRMEQIPILQFIGKILPIEEFRNVELRQAQLDLRADDGRVYVDSLVMESPNMGITAKGTGGFDGKLNLGARLAINSKVSHQLPEWLDANFQPIANSDRKDIGFKITGTVSHPKTDLMDVLVGQKYGNQLKNLWNAITGKPKKKAGDKKKTETETSQPDEGEPDLPREAHPTETPLK